MADAVAQLPAPEGLRNGRARAAEPARGGAGPFLAALAVLTPLAVATGFALAWLVHDRIAPPPETAAAERPVEPLRYAAGATLHRLSPVVTNLRSPSDVWIRVDLALVMEEPDEGARSRLATEIAADALSYLRTLDLAQIEGASGLLFLREDLTDRAAARSQGAVREVVLESLVVQ
ncbi:MAG: flagellar basal body-associated FliL family protein [Microvirga sp.]|nr:flagellar basal body-associated FliL family protein [Microvirga sp.]